MNIHGMELLFAFINIILILFALAVGTAVLVASICYIKEYRERHKK